ncbi:sirohydrochlorin chelatase [Planomonospora corallina]|uniref:Sirohydrochlorin chelatase n=1 Tax=Planomonospora corallina TaxID=1806052 RepID=A0ABV8IF53_9ACTN
MKPPLLLIGQGSLDDGASAEFGRFVHRLRCRLDGVAADVSGGFVTRARPRLSDSVTSLVARGHHRLVVLPLSLAGDLRIGTEVSAAMAREQERHPTLDCDHGRPLGRDPRILALLAERLADAAAEVPRLRLVPAGAPAGGPLDDEPERVEPGDTAVVLVGDGSTDPTVNADVHGVSRLFWETFVPEYLTVETAFASVTPPGVPGGIERCRRLGARRVIVLPYLMFAGGLLEKVWAQAMAYAAGHPELDVRCAEVIGDCDGLADVVVERYEEALGAGPR